MKSTQLRFAVVTLTVGSVAALGQTAGGQADHSGAGAKNTNTHSPEMVTSAQADVIIGELKRIRQLLEKQEGELARATAPQAPAAPPPPEKVEMNVRNGWYSIGRDDAPVTLVEFADYQCTFCKRFQAGAYADLKKNYINTGKVRFVSRDLPLDFHSYALKAAEAVRCAGDQGKYWEFRDALFATSDPPNDDVTKKLAQTLLNDQAAFQSCLTSDKYKAEIQEDAAEAAKLQISGTPSFVLAKTANDKLDGVRIIGAQPYASFEAAILEILKSGTEVARK